MVAKALLFLYSGPILCLSFSINTALFKEPLRTLPFVKDAEEMVGQAVDLRTEGFESTIEALMPKEVVKVEPTCDIFTGSIWTFKYCFVEEPKDEDLDVKFRTGQLTVQFQAGGSSEMIWQEVGPGGMKVSDIKDWKVEHPVEDGKEYLLFSLDAEMFGNKQIDQFYFQARRSTDSAGAVVLSEGTVSVKQRMSGLSPWETLAAPASVFMTQFRYVGDFVATPRPQPK